MFRLGVLSLLVIISCCATTVAQEVLLIRAHDKYAELTSAEEYLVEEIMDRALDSDRKEYYFQKLTLLLDTDTLPAYNTTELNRRSMNRSVKEVQAKRRAIVNESEGGLEEYLKREELYENEIERNWKGYRPEFVGPFFYIVDDNPLDILVHIKVRLHGDFNIVSKVLLLEDAIEKHLALEGFSVNLVFVGYSGGAEDVFDVKVNPGEWTTSHNWSGSYQALAHELMHLMGLPDEYDRIESHADNKHMSRLQRLYQFRRQMIDNIPADAKDGIMCYHIKKPLHRHVCMVVDLGEECVIARKKAFGN